MKIPTFEDNFNEKTEEVRNLSRIADLKEICLQDIKTFDLCLEPLVKVFLHTKGCKTKVMRMVILHWLWLDPVLAASLVRGTFGNKIGMRMYQCH
jgi:hypothetical protein